MTRSAIRLRLVQRYPRWEGAWRTWTLDLWDDRLVLGRYEPTGGRWRRLAQVVWHPRTWRDVLYVRLPWERAP